MAGVGDALCVAPGRDLRARERRLVLAVELLEGEGGARAAREHAFYDLELQSMVPGVVVALAKKDIGRARGLVEERRALHPCAAARIEDTSLERMGGRRAGGERERRAYPAQQPQQPEVKQRA